MAALDPEVTTVETRTGTSPCTYRGSIDVAPLERLGWPGTVFRPLEWGQVMYGGAVFDLDGRHFDIHYRNLDVVDHWTAEAEVGRFEVHLLGFHLAGIPTYMLVGELATGRTLLGSLPRPSFPDQLRDTAPRYWLDRAASEINYAGYWAMTENPVSCAGALARAVLSAAHGRMAYRGEWALNEKRLLQSAGLGAIGSVFASLGSTRRELDEARSRVAAVVEEIRREVQP